MQVNATPVDGGTHYELFKESVPIGSAFLTSENCFSEFCIDPAWQRRGYGSYLLKEILRCSGGYTPNTESFFTAPFPQDAGGQAFAAKFGFVPGGGRLCRRRLPDLTAVGLVHSALRSLLPPGGFYLDATCGNGHDTLFLAELAAGGQVLGLDIQPAAVDATNALLRAHGYGRTARAVCADHRDLLQYTTPGTANCVLFNFGWLPGAAHDVHSTAGHSLPALRAGLAALKPGGVLAAVLYSGRVIGDDEKTAALAFFRALPLTQYTVLVCDFANWADTAPLPCLILKKEVTPP